MALLRWVVGVAVLLAAVAFAGTAAAQSTAVNVDRSEVEPGETVTVTGQGFRCNDGSVDDVGDDGPVEVFWDGDSTWDGKPFETLPSQPFADGDGDVRFEVPIPADATPGVRFFTVVCLQTYAGARFTVLEAPTSTTTTTTTTTTGTTTTTTDKTTTTTTTTDTVAAAQRAELPRALASPSEVGFTWLTLLMLLAVAALLVLLLYLPLIGFPDEVANRSFEERHQGALALQVAPSWVQVGLFAVVAGVLLCLVDPSAAFDLKTVALGLGLTMAVLLTTLAYEVPGQQLRFWLTEERAVLRTLPLALLIALVCAAVSRVADFQPGYVYGLIAGYPAMAAAVAERAEGRRTEAKGVLAGVGVTLMVSLIAWLLWNRVDAAAESPGAGFGTLVLDATLAATTLMGLQTVLFRLIPLRLLDGLALAGWSRTLWAAVYLPTTLAYLVVLIRESEPVTSAAIAKAIALFVGFGVLSLAYWAWVSRVSSPGSRRRRPSP